MGLKQKDISNKLLRSLSPTAFNIIEDHLAHIDLPLHYKIAEPNQFSKNFVFPNTGVASVIGILSEIWQELGMFGSEGAGSISQIMSHNRSVNLITMQVQGEGSCIDLDVMRLAFDKNSEIRELMLAYMDSAFIQISYTAASNVQCTSIDRLSRWLLMIQDRVCADYFDITTNYVAAMLGLGQLSVRISMKELVEEGLISYQDKRVTILNRDRLLKKVSLYYGGAEREYNNIMQARIHRYTP